METYLRSTAFINYVTCERLFIYFTFTQNVLYQKIPEDFFLTLISHYLMFKKKE